MLAYRLYPFAPGQNVVEYTGEQLMEPETVKKLFDYCQILEAYITKKGWAFLTDHYGYEKLYEIDKKSGWTDEDTLAGYIERVRYYISISADE